LCLPDGELTGVGRDDPEPVGFEHHGQNPAQRRIVVDYQNLMGGAGHFPSGYLPGC
jgi:hypothetical protein